jgi:hypothetical protein
MTDHYKIQFRHFRTIQSSNRVYGACFITPTTIDWTKLRRCICGMCISVIGTFYRDSTNVPWAWSWEMTFIYIPRPYNVCIQCIASDTEGFLMLECRYFSLRFLFIKRRRFSFECSGGFIQLLGKANRKRAHEGDMILFLRMC